jgi:hypothetical protein
MPNRLRDFSDFNTGDLNNSKNNYVIKYNSSESSYSLVSPDTILSGAAADQDLPNDFAEVVSGELNVDNIAFLSFDGGQF